MYVCIIWKLVTCQRITSQYSTSMGQHLSPRYGQMILVSGYIDVHFVFSWAPKLARKCDSNHWFPCGADGRPVGWYTVTWLPNFLGWVDLLSYGAPPTRARMELRSKLASGRSKELKLWSIGGEFNRQINKLGFPRCITNS